MTSYTVLWLTLVGVARGTLWGQVYLEEQHLYAPYQTAVNEALGTGLTAGTRRCDMLPWCFTSCKDPDGTYHSSDLQVSPLYRNASEGLVCHTRLKPDLAFDKPFYNVDTFYSTGSHRNAAHLFDGLNTRDHDQCLHNAGSKLWVVVDLGSVFDVKTVALTRAHGGSGYPLSNVEVRVGNTLITDGNLGSYKLLAFYVGPPADGDRVEIGGRTPIRGRYVSVEKVNHADGNLLFCHLEVFA